MSKTDDFCFELCSEIVGKIQAEQKRRAMKHLIKEMREAAEKATQGEWVVVSDLPSYAIIARVGTGPFYPRVVQTENQAMFKHSEWRGGIESDVNANHIATSSPENVLKLIEYVEELERNYQDLLDGKGR